jgi:hypothetical protein
VIAESFQEIFNQTLNNDDFSGRAFWEETETVINFDGGYGKRTLS